ncbi:MAG: hypothetical protein LUE98_07740 [Tannerellaceae bacterium]|nr:hypothetical protein [Tannerellaceae bacterium]
MEKYPLIAQITILVLTPFCSWLFSKLHTKREKQKIDLEIIQAAIAPQLDSIQQLTAHNNQLVQMYLDE